MKSLLQLLPCISIQLPPSLRERCQLNSFDAYSSIDCMIQKLAMKCCLVLRENLIESTLVYRFTQEQASPPQLVYPIFEVQLESGPFKQRGEQLQNRTLLRLVSMMYVNSSFFFLFFSVLWIKPQEPHVMIFILKCGLVGEAEVEGLNLDP
jgi:hypothetical protein